VCGLVVGGWSLRKIKKLKKNQITYFALLILDSSVLLPKATFEFISFSLQSAFQNHQTRLNVSKLRGLLLGAVEISVQRECAEMKKLRKWKSFYAKMLLRDFGLPAGTASWRSEPNTRRRRGALLASGFVTSSCSVNRATTFSIKTV